MKKSNATALKFAGVFFSSNLALNFLTIGVVVLLALISLVPVIGIISGILLSFVVYSYQVYLGKNISGLNSEEEVVKFAKETKLGDFLFKYFNVAAGIWVGSLIVFGVIGFIFFVLGLAPLIHDYQMYKYTGNMYLSSSVIVVNLFFLLIYGFLFYVFPGVVGEAMKTETFADSLKKMFLLINPKFWVKTFNVKYFLLILGWSIIVTIGVIIGEVTLLFLIGFLILYYLSLYSAIIFIFSAELLEEKRTTSTQ
ncbi:hypothetical protein [Caminibacter sp.]